MDWTTVYTETLTSHEFLSASLESRGAWISCLGRAAERETEGILVGAKSWTRRDWVAIAGVTLGQVEAAVEDGLLEWRGDDLAVRYYDTAREANLKVKREVGAKFAKLRHSGDGSPKNPETVGRQTPSGSDADLRSGDPERSGSEIPPNPPSGGQGIETASPGEQPRRARKPRERKPKQAHPTWTGRLIAIFHEEWPKAHGGQKYQRCGFDAGRAKAFALAEGGDLDEAWWRETCVRYFRDRDHYVVAPSENHSLWWLLDKGLSKYGVGKRTVSHQEATKAFEANHERVRAEERSGNHAFTASLFGGGAFEAPSSGAEADRIARERQIAAVKARQATT